MIKPIGLMICLFLYKVTAATDPGSMGTHPIGQLTAHLPGENQKLLATDIFFPGTPTSGVAVAASPCPVVVLGHGFLQSKAHHNNQGRLLASRGFIVLIPQFNSAADHQRNGRELRRCLDWIGNQQTNAGSIFRGRVRLDRIGASGHSAGGLSALLAAAGDARIRALSLMDPVDHASQGQQALGRLNLPVSMTWSEPSGGNNRGSAERLFVVAQGIKRGIKICGANHTDAQNPSGWLCRLVCGAPDAKRQYLYNRYMAGWFELFLHDDATYIPWVFALAGGPVAADLDSKLITYSAENQELALQPGNAPAK